jgi:hypothetical protein
MLWTIDATKVNNAKQKKYDIRQVQIVFGYLWDSP